MPFLGWQAAIRKVIFSSDHDRSAERNAIESVGDGGLQTYDYPPPLRWYVVNPYDVTN